MSRENHLQNNNKKVILFSDEDNDSNGEENFNIALEKKQFQGKKGQMLMELQQSYKDDQRFYMDKKFKGDVDSKKVSKNLKNMSTLFDKKKDLMSVKLVEQESQEEISTEKNKNLSILSQVISNKEFLTHNKKYTGNIPKNILIKRFDPKLNLGRQLEITGKKESEEKINFESVKNVIKLDKGVDKFKQEWDDDSNSVPKSKKSKKIEIENMFNKLNDQIENKVEIKYDSWKQILKVPEQTGFGLFGETLTENKSKIIEKKKKKREIEEIIQDESQQLTETNEAEIDTEELIDDKSDANNEKKLLKSKRKKDKRKLKEKEKKEKAKIDNKLRDDKIESKLKKNLLKEYDEKKVEDYVRYVNLVRNKKHKQS
jgi:hypothetical protein